jgi:hypothetical protein
MNGLPFAFSIGTFTLDGQSDTLMMGPFNPLASIIGQSLAWHDHTPSTNIEVGPITTTEFPDTLMGHGKRFMRKRTRSDQCGHCSICIEHIKQMTRAISLPCGHCFHRICIFAVLTTSTLGSNSMMRCPLCRYRLDRYDLHRGNSFSGGR